MKRLRLYLETTIPNFVLADDVPEANQATRDLLSAVRAGEYQAFISTEVIREIMDAGEPKQRRLLELVSKEPWEILDISPEVLGLANEITDRGIIPYKYLSDAVHIAAAVVYDIDAIVSWNFEHIVRLKTKLGVNGLARSLGYKEIDILSPMELK